MQTKLIDSSSFSAITNSSAIINNSSSSSSTTQDNSNSFTQNNKRIKNIDFKIDSSMRRLLGANQPISSQKLLPTTRINKSIAGSLRLLPKESNLAIMNKQQQQQQQQQQTHCSYQLPTNLINKLISSSSSTTQQAAELNSNNQNSQNNQNNNFLLNMTSLDEKFVKEFTSKAHPSANNSNSNVNIISNPISEPGKRVIAFYHRKIYIYIFFSYYLVTSGM